MRARDWFILFGGSVGTYLLCKTLYAASATPLPWAKGGSAPAIPPSPRPPIPMNGPSMTLQPGARYFATVTVGFPASLGASVSKITELAQEQGFVNVSVTKQKPQGWPGQASGDYYLYGEYRGQPQSFGRNPAPGVEVVEAFVQ